jgi:hypothetical protein
MGIYLKKGTEKSELNLFIIFRDSFFYFAILDILKMSNLHIRPKESAKRLCKLWVYPNLVGIIIKNEAKAHLHEFFPSSSQKDLGDFLIILQW